MTATIPDMLNQRSCVGHQHLERTALVLHHLRPLARGGKDVTETNGIWMCPNFHVSVHTILDELEKEAMRGPASTPNNVIRQLNEKWRMTFPVIARGIAYKGWQMYGGEMLAGRWNRSVELWTTDGTPTDIGVLPYSQVMHLSRIRKRLLGVERRL